jgi:hypothetical protein
MQKRLSGAWLALSDKEEELIGIPLRGH